MVCIRSTFRVKEGRMVRMKYRVCSTSDMYLKYIAAVQHFAVCIRTLAVQSLKFIFKLKLRV